MAKQIYIDENGNEQLVSGTINNAELLPISSSDTMNTKDYIDSKVAVSRPTVVATTGNTLMYDNSVKYGKMISITCAIKVTAGANQYTHIATVTEKPVNIVTIPSVNNVNATYCGMINISNTDGHINIYPLTALSSNTISFTVTYYQP